MSEAQKEAGLSTWDRYSPDELGKMSYFERLGLDENATSEQIRTAVQRGIKHFPEAFGQKGEMSPEKEAKLRLFSEAQQALKKADNYRQELATSRQKSAPAAAGGGGKGSEEAFANMSGADLASMLRNLQEVQDKYNKPAEAKNPPINNEPGRGRESKLGTVSIEKKSGEAYVIDPETKVRKSEKYKEIKLVGNRLFGVGDFEKTTMLNNEGKKISGEYKADTIYEPKSGYFVLYQKYNYGYIIRADGKEVAKCKRNPILHSDGNFYERKLSQDNQPDLSERITLNE